MRAGFEGGQMPLYMRVGKLRGATSKDAMPIVPFMTRTQPVNVKALEERFEAGAGHARDAEGRSPDPLDADRREGARRGRADEGADRARARRLGYPREKIEAAGGTVVLLRAPAKKRSKKASPLPAAEAPWASRLRPTSSPPRTPR